ncbi:MAG: hypothetical protein LUH82_00930 [Clostridiales bacterium]|nr:hypothetical protein [Clostridiales bacterium]
MTTANDFRSYYSVNTVSALDAFNVTRSSAAPELEPRPKKKLSVRPNTKKKSPAQIKAEQKAAFRSSVLLLTSVVVFIAMVSGVLCTYVKKNELTRSISSIKSEITMAESDNISLNAQLEGMVSMSQIEDYAVNNLGMVRMETSQIVYIDTSEFIFERAKSLGSETQSTNAQ